MHLIQANSFMIPKSGSHKYIGILNSMVECLVVDIIEYLFLNILLKKSI